MNRRQGLDSRQRTPREVSLEPSKIANAAQRLARRIAERFPSRNLAQHASSFAEHAQLVVEAGENDLAPPSWVRVGSWIGGAGALLVLVSPFVIVRKLDGIEVLPDFLQALDSALTTLAAAVAGFFTMRSISKSHTRKRALDGLNRLRAFIHVTDMYQLNKSPVKLAFAVAPTPSSLPRETDVVELGAYLDYCGELAALVAKLAALYAHWAPDATVISTVDDIEDRCSELERKIASKLLLLDRVRLSRSNSADAL